jgi:hypothetical protein
MPVSFEMGVLACDSVGAYLKPAPAIKGSLHEAPACLIAQVTGIKRCISILLDVQCCSSLDCLAFSGR